MAQNDERRVRKTKKAMQDALAGLLLEKPLKNISVREIAEIADINRGTFYLHYRDVYDMVEQLQSEFFERFNVIFDNYEPEKRTDNIFPVIAAVFQLLAENADFARVLLGKNGDAAFLDKLKNLLREKCFVNAQKLLNIKNDEEFYYFFHYITSGCVGIFDAWLNGGMKETPLEMASFTEKFILDGAKTFK